MALHSAVELKQMSGMPAEDTLTLSAAQQRLWFLSQMQGIRQAHHITWGLHIHGTLDRSVLKRALDRIIERHQVLRATFKQIQGKPWQRAAPPDSGFELREHNLRDGGHAEDKLERICQEEASRLFDLEEGPLIRGRLICLAPQEHVLFISMHNLVSDEWSKGILASELNALYQAYIAGEDDPLPQLAMQYSDYALWQQQQLSDAGTEREREYWQRALEGAPSWLELPTDRPRLTEQASACDVVEFELNASLTRELKVLGERHAMTLEMLIMAGWSVVLSRLSGQRDLVIGLALPNRTRPGTAGMIGPFANKLALRNDTTGTMAELLQKVRRRIIEALEHQELPFEHVVEIVNPPRSIARAPIFQVMLVWQEQQKQAANSSALRVRDEQTNNAVSEFDLELVLGVNGNRIAGGLKYATALFNRSTIEWHVGYLRQALAAMVADESQENDRVPLLSDIKRAFLLELGNGDLGVESIVTPEDVCLYGLVAAQAERVPQAVAVIEPGREITYKQLVQQANGLGQQLRELGVGLETRIAIFADRSAESLIGVLGILAAGGAYVPLDPSLPQERIAFILKDASVHALVTPAALAERGRSAIQRAGSAARLVMISGAPMAEFPPDSRTTPANAAYVIYTSGSTGTPKGVVVEHQGAINLVRGFAARHDFAEHRLLMIPSLVFDASVGDVFPALAAGGTLVLHPAPAELGWLELEQFCRKFKITAIDAPAALWRRWTDGFASYQGTAPLLPDLTLIMIGGESVPLEQVRLFAQLTQNRVLLANHYGPTEVSVCATMMITRDGSDLDCQDLPIGKPLPGVRVYVVDEHLQLAPRGAIGELCIGGAGVAREYLNRPELTMSAFMNDPFSPGLKARIYRTGDLVRWNADGTLQFIGRLDRQVKIRGMRVELGEIEACIAEYPDVREAVVLTREDHPGNRLLAAYIVTRTAGNGSNRAQIDVEALRSHLSSLLPDYMVPAAYVLLDELPLNANGKVDRKKLPAPDSGAYLAREYQAPVGERENTVAAIWAEVLKREPIGRNDNFFELGGHSLLALSAIERMRAAGFHVDVRDLFARPVLKDLVEAAGQESRAIIVPANLIPVDCTMITPAMLPLLQLSQEEIEEIVDSVPGGAANVQDIYPLAPLQEGILFHHLLETEGDPYLTTRLLAIETRQNLDRYLAALQTVVDRHDILRTGFAWKGLPEPVQVVWRRAPLSVEEVSLDPAAGDISEQLRARFDSRHYRLDVRHAPLFRLVIAGDPANNRWLILELMHHLIGDQMTLLVMQQEIRAIVDEDDRLPAALPFRDFVVQARQGVSREEHEAFFTRMLKDVDEPTAPFGLTDAQGDGSRIVEMRREIDSGLSQRLRAEAQKLGVTPATICHLAWALVLARVSGRDDVVFGTVMFGRMKNSEGSGRGLGLFINTLPVRIRVGGESAAASVRKTHELLTQLLRHEHASLGLAQRCSSVRPPVPLFTSLLNYRHVGAADDATLTTANKLQPESIPAGTDLSAQLLGEWERTNFPFALFLNDMGQDLSMDVQVDSSIPPQRVCALMHTALEALVDALQNAPEKELANLSVLPEAEQQKVLYGWNATQAEYPREKCLHQLFEEQMEKTPDATALVFENESLSYAELNRRANDLAYSLREMGVKADERVGVCAERGIEMVVALYAVLKAGGAYLPMDPDYPEERLQYMLKDSRPIAVLTQGHLLDRIKTASAASGQEQPVIDLHATALPQQRQATTNLEAAQAGLTPGHLAYVIYTSGSTGAPKGAMIEHTSIVNRLIWMQNAYPLNAEDAVLQKTPFSFDVSVWEFFWPLLTGARLVLARPGGHKDPRYLCETIAKNQITTLHFVPSMLQAFLEYADAGSCSSIKNIICSGEALSPVVARRCRELLPAAKLHNLYGPTEAAIDVTAWTCPARVPEATVPIGRPIANTQIYILDHRTAPVPVGVAGELYIGGVQVGRGYLNRDELTEERFVNDPFAKKAGARMYRTGDLGRWLEDGNIEYLGRNDFQVKVRGFRIELGEIESRLLEHGGVREAVVVARPNQTGEQQLVAYYVSHGQANPDVEELRRHLSARLPEYMVPAAYVSMEKLPLTSSGKLDRKALPVADTSAYLIRGYEAPVGETENTIASIWAGVLKLERIGRNDNFFELGGHSLLAVTVIERMREAGLALDVRALFAAPTLKGLAEAAGGESRAIAVPENLIPAGCTAITPAMLPLVSLSQSDIEKIAAGVPGGTANIQDIYPLAPLQEGILFHHRLTQEGDVYLTGTLLAIESREDLERHLKAVQAVIDRHDILRTAIAWESLPEPVQVVWRKAQIKVEEATFDPARDDIAQQLLARFSPRHYRIDVRYAPLWRLFIAEDVPNHRWVLLDLMHHMVVDHVTLEILQREIQAIAQGKAEQLPLPLPFRNFVAQTRLGITREEHEAFFTRMLADVDEPTAPFGLTNVQGDGSNTKEGHRRVDPELFPRLRAQARAMGVSVASMCHLAWALVLARTSGRDDVVFGTVMFGRMLGGKGSDRALGIFINTLPLRIKLAEDSVQASVRNTHALLAQLLRHEHASLGLAQRCSSLQPPAPLFTSILNYRHTISDSRDPETGVKAAEEWAGWKVLGVEDRNNYPFALSINDFGEGLGFDVKVDGSIDPQQVCDWMHTALESLTATLESNPSAPVRRAEVLAPKVREQLLYGWNSIEAEYPENACLHVLFEKQAEKTPELPAVASQGKGLSYRELNRRANQLGHYLRNLGVRPDVRVGICMRRSVEMIVGVMAIMKAGGAYVPLDPAYPAERLRYMMEDAGILIVLTQKEVEPGLRGSGIWPVCVDEAEEMDRIAQESHENPEPITALENLAYVIYTSGSTGKSKGVGIEQRQLANYVNGILRDLQQAGLGEGAKYATVSTLSADLGNTVIYPSLVSGGELHVIEEDHVMDGLRLGEYFEREQIDCLKIVPSHLQGLRAARGGEKVMPRKLLVVGGEASSWQWVKEWTAISGCTLINHYGPTETTVGVLRYLLPKEQTEQPGETVPIGQPLGNVQAYVVNKDMEPVPIGVAGELYIGGASVGRGYVNHPELTAERFVPDPFSGTGRRLYKTGDLVRRNKDGNIQFLGRADHQVKIRGFRIELGEIEAALRQQPEIEHAVVVVAESEDGNKRIVAYVTANGPGQDHHKSSAIDIEQLRARLSLLLPDYMVPAAYVVLDKLPLTPNGKVDRKALPSADAGAYITHDYEAPVGEMETALARIWAEVLKVDRVGRNDNFFELGGHSLLAISVIERMREAGLMLEVGALFNFPILKDMAGNAGGDPIVQAPPNLIPAGCTAITPEMLPLIGLNQREIDKIVATVPGGAANVQDIYPLAPLQEGILFHHLMSSEGDIYLNQTILGGSRERLDRYIKALQIVIARHDILRTAVVWEGLPEPVQVVWRNALLSIEEIGVDPAAGDVVEQLRSRFNPQHYRLDVRQAPLWRLIIAQDAPNNRWVMLELAHHLVADNTSIRFLLREIEMILQGKPDLLPTPLPFRNFVAQARMGVSRQEHEAFFTRMLGDVDEPTAPFGLTNVHGDTSRILEGHRTVNPEVCRRLRVQARSLGVSAASLCHLAWALVLARTSGRKDVVFGTVMFGRMQGGEGSDRVMGIFINTLPLRIEVGDEDVRTSVRKTHELQTQLFRHEHASLALVQRCSAVAAPAPLFTSILNYRHLREEAISAEKGAEAMVDLEYLGGQERNNYPFALAINDLGEAMTLDVKVDDSIDPEQVCGWMHTALESLVGALESAPDMATHGLEVLPPAETEQLIYSWNRTKVEYAHAESIHGLFEEQAERTPELRAVVSSGTALSYLELNQRANQLAHYLRKQGVRCDDRVGIFMKRNVEMVTGLLGILKAGAAYVGLDTTFPDERLRYMVEDAGARIVFTQQNLAERLRGIQAQLVCLDSPQELAGIAQESRQNPGPVAALENLAYVVYTSGSTGKPKGVGIEHRQLVNYVQGITRDLEKLGVGAGAKYATVSTLSADLGNTAIYPSLLSGGELHVIDEDHVMDGQRLGEYFERENIDCLKIVPSHLEGLRSAGGGDKVMPRKVLVSGGEALPWKWARDWRLTNGCALINHYGPTETTVGAVRFLVPPGKNEEGIVPIGQPLDNVQLYVLNQYMELVPSGAVGELYIGGAGVGRGYVNRPELTAERFMPDPFFGQGRRLYKTGDLVRRNKGGDIEFLGRVDQQLKIRGFRIELGEIEEALRQQPGIAQAAVAAIEGENGSKRLVAYIVPLSSPENGDALTALDVELLRTRLGSLLPDYMVPAAYVLLDELPLNANGKVDRKKLPAPDSAAYLAREYQAPVGERENTVAAIWAEVLKREPIGRNDNFFELGGHSLLALSAIERMRGAGFHVDVRDLFARPVLKDLVEAAGQESRATIAVPANLIPADCTMITPAMLPLLQLSQEEIEKIVDSVPGGAANVQDIYPLAPLQEGILFHHLLETEGDVYLSATLLGAATRERLDRYVAALQIVVDRHDILRTAILWEGLPEPVQVVWRRAPLSVEEVKLDPAAGDISEQLRASFDPRHNRLDIRQAPMWRLYIAQDVPNQRWVILELKHHLTGDNTTSRFLLNEVRTILHGQAKSLPEPLPFRNFVAQARLGVSRQEHEVFFTRMLKDVDEPTLPFGMANVQGDGSRIVEVSRNVDPGLNVKLRALARALGVTVASMCHLAWATVLARTSGRDDVVFGTVLFGRMQGGEGADRSLGIFINTLPIRIRVGNEGVATSVRRTHQLLTELFRHEHASLALVQRCSSVQAPAPLFTSLLNYRHVREEVASSETAQKMANLEFIESHGRTNYPFSVRINDLGQDLSIDALVEASIAPQRVCALMHTALESLVNALENAPESPVQGLSVLPEEERRQVLYTWNATETEYPRDKFLHELFEEQVERTPHATAVVLENQSLTYDQLNQHANRLAHYLRTLGVKPDARVGICVERGIDTIVSLLAVLKAEGAYVPLDPGYPAERLRFMLKDSEPMALLIHYHLRELFTDIATDIPVVELNGNGEEWSDQPATNPNYSHEGLRTENLAYVIYTSGSTGVPKGVALEHRNAVNYVCWARQNLAAFALEQTLFSTSLNFDLAVFECFAPLTTGGTIRVVTNVLELENRLLNVTLVATVPSAMRALVESNHVPPTVRAVVLGGELLKKSLVEEIFATTQVEKIFNIYGPTETTTNSTWMETKRGEPYGQHIGRPVANTQVYILDPRMEPVPIGVVGEIYIAGAGVTRGYLNRPQLTEERFLKDPFAGKPGSRMYRTGDLGRWLENGNIEYRGRNDFQVKVRGVRIELGEIEARLLEHPGVREAIVMAREDKHGEQHLAAYYTPAPGAAPDTEELQKHLAEKLTEHMVPRVYISLERFPLTASGKLDRKALPAPDAEIFEGHQYEAPQGETETALAAIWAEILKLERVGRNDNFFDMGGHSLLAIQLGNRIRATLGVALDLRDIFAATTLKDMATVLSALVGVQDLLPDASPADATRSSEGRYL